MPRLWDAVTPEGKEALRKFMGPSWEPDRQEPQKVKVEGKLETLEELTKLMKQGLGFYRD